MPTTAPPDLNAIVPSEAPYVSGTGWTFSYPPAQTSLSTGDSTTIVTLSRTIAAMPITELALSIDVGASWSGAIAWVGGQAGFDLSFCAPTAMFWQRPETTLLAISGTPSTLGAISFGAPLPSPLYGSIYPVIVSLTPLGTATLSPVPSCRWTLAFASPTLAKSSSVVLIRGPVSMQNV